MDELTEQEKHLYDQGYLSDQKIAKLAKLYKKSNLLPILMTTNLFGKDRSNNIKDLIIDYERKNPVGMESNVKAWASVYKTHLLTDIFSNYLNLILQHSQNLYNKSFSTKEVLEVGEFWVAHYRKGNFTVKHDHGNLLDEFLISGCYYAYVDDNASPIIFDGQKSVYPKSDSLILFSPYTKHEVPPTDGERIVMSFNIIGTSPYS
jgi:hypothetical protein